jgi:hypothetical protein
VAQTTASRRVTGKVTLLKELAATRVRRVEDEPRRFVLGSVSIVASWRGNYAKFLKYKSPVFTGGLVVSGRVGGLTCGFWAVFGEIILCSAEGGDAQGWGDISGCTAFLLMMV